MNNEIFNQLLEITDEEKQILDEGGKISKGHYTDEYEFVIDSTKLLEKGRLVSVRPHTRFAAFPKHRHNYVEMVYMYNGSTTHIINGEEVVLEKGDILLIGSGCTQEIFPAGYEDLAVNFIILPEFFETDLKNSEDSVAVEFITDFLMSKNGGDYLHFKTSDVRPVVNLAENLIWLHYNSKKRSMMRATMKLLIMTLAGFTDRITAKDKTGDYDRGIFFSLLSYLESNYNNAELIAFSKLVNEDIYYVGRVIKKFTGKTFKELLQAKRLARAVYLLENTQFPVSQIIYSVGYENTSYFHKIFKEKYGCTPSNYRR